MKNMYFYAKDCSDGVWCIFKILDDGLHFTGGSPSMEWCSFIRWKDFCIDHGHWNPTSLRCNDYDIQILTEQQAFIKAL